MSLKKFRLLAVCGLLSTSIFSIQSAAASRFDANFGADSARIGLDVTIMQAQSGSDLEIGASYLGSEIDDDTDASVFTANAHIVGDAGTGFLKTQAAVGTQFYFTDVEDVDGGALAVGGFFIARLQNFDRLGFSAEAYFAPDLLTFGDTDQVLEYSIAVEYDLLRETTIYLNYRQVKVDFEFDNFDDEVTVDTGANLGVRILF